MFRALNHEGVAADCLWALVQYVVARLGGRKRIDNEQRLKAYTACAVVAVTMARVRGQN